MKKIILPLSILLGLSTPVIAEEDPTKIIITSSRVAESTAEIGTSVTVLTKEDIDVAGYSSVTELLRTVSGIGVSNTGGEGKASTLRIRGEEGYRTLVMIDGVDISDPTGTQVGPQLQHLLLNGDVEKIEILRGSQGFIYGADAGGVVNIFTPQGVGPFSSNIKLEAGSFGTKRFNVNASGGNEKTDFFVSIGENSTDGFNSRKSDSDGEEDGYENTTLHGKFGVNPIEDLRIQLVIRDIDSENEFDGCFVPVTFGSTNNCIGDFEQTTSKFSFDYENGTLSQHIAYAFTDISRENFSNGITSFSTEGDISRLEYWGSLAYDSSRFIYGVDLEKEDVSTNSGEDLERDQLGFYGEYKGSFAKRFFVTIGARQDDNDDFGKYTSGRLSLAYLQSLSSGSTIKYRTSYGTGFRAPSLSEIAYNRSPAAFAPAAGVELQEELSQGYDLGVDVEFRNGFILQVTYFDQIIEDEIFFDLSGFSGYLQETGDTESTGVELAIGVPLSSSWEVYSNYTYNDTKDRDGNQRIRRPRHLANVGVQYFSVDSKLTASTNIRASRDAQDQIFGIGRVDLDDYIVVDLNVSYEITNRVSVYGNIKNVFDEEYEEVTGFNTAERAFYAGVKFSL